MIYLQGAFTEHNVQDVGYECRWIRRGLKNIQDS